MKKTGVPQGSILGPLFSHPRNHIHSNEGKDSK